MGICRKNHLTTEKIQSINYSEYITSKSYPNWNLRRELAQYLGWHVAPCNCRLLVSTQTALNARRHGGVCQIVKCVICHLHTGSYLGIVADRSRLMHGWVFLAWRSQLTSPHMDETRAHDDHAQGGKGESTLDMSQRRSRSGGYIS
jgi:hypothetical protein